MMEQVVIWVLYAVLTGTFFFLEWKRSRNKRLFLRLIASFLMVTSLLLIYLSPTYTIDAPVKSIFLNQSDEEVPDSLKNKNTKIISQFSDFIEAKKKYTVSDLKVAGYGLEKWEMKKVDVPYHFYPSKLPEGILSIRHTQAFAGNDLQISGSARTEDSIKIVLETPEGNDYSDPVYPSDPSFTFTVRPVVSGNFLYQVHGVREIDTIFSEKFPIKIRELTKPGMLVLTGSPTFETKYLINHLEKEGFELVVRQKTSEGIYYEEFINSKKKDLSVLSEDLLKDFRILIIDEEILLGLGSVAVKKVLNRVREGKLGVLLLAQQPFRVEQIEVVSKDPKELNLNNKIKVKSKSVTLGSDPEPVRFKEQKIGEYVQFGLGKIALSLLSNTYPILLKGEKTIYQEIWKKLLDPVSGYVFDEKYRKLTPVFPIKRFPTKLSLYYPDTLPEVKLGHTFLPAKEFPLQPDLYEVSFWPQKEGWQRIMISDEPFDFYVFPEGSWNTLRKSRLVQQNLAFIPAVKNSTGKKIEKGIPEWIFYIMFLLSAGFLWFEERI